MRLAVGDPEYPCWDVQVYGKNLKGVRLADEEAGVLRIAVFDAQGNMLRTPRGEPVEVELRAPFRIVKARL